MNMQTGVNLDLPVVERSKAPFFCEVVRPLLESDSIVRGALGSQTPALKKIRDVHHRIALLLAQGLKPGEVSGVTGFSPSRISILQNDPSFKELLAFYRERQKEIRIDALSRLDLLGADVVAELHHRLEEDPEGFSVKNLTDLAAMTLDRTGKGPTTKSVSLIGVLSPEDLADLKAATNKGVVIIDQTNSKPSLGGSDSREPVAEEESASEQIQEGAKL